MSTIKVDNLQTTGGAGLYPAKAWVNFNGSGTVAIRDDGNVSSITDNGTGQYSANFSSSFSSANYVTTGSSGHDTVVSTGNRVLTLFNNPTSSQVNFWTSYGPNGTAGQDDNLINLTSTS